MFSLTFHRGDTRKCIVVYGKETIFARVLNNNIEKGIVNEELNDENVNYLEFQRQISEREVQRKTNRYILFTPTV